MSQESPPPINFICKKYDEHEFEEEEENKYIKKKCTKCGYKETEIPNKY